MLREGNRVRISVKLIDAASDQHIWSETYERPFDDVMAIQNSVARTVARIVQANLTAQDEDQLARVLEIRPKTFEAYLRAMFQYQKETQEGYQAGIEILEKALANDPTSALAYAALGQGYSELVHSVLPKMEAMKRARAAVEKAVELDPTLAEAHMAQGLHQLYGEWNGEAAEASLKLAMELNPSLADAWYHWAWLLELMGNDEEAIAAHENFAHLPFWAYALGQTYAWAGQPEKALEVAQVYEKESRKEIPLTIIYAALGDVEKVLYWSAQAREKKLPWSLGLFSYFTAPRSLLQDPRIRAEAAQYPTPLVPYPKK